MKKIIITGVSTGIGYSCTKILCNSGYFVYGSVRKSEDAERIKNKLGDNFHPLVFDVTDSKAILENIEKDRPIYFAVTVAPSNRLGLDNYLEMQGLVYQITNSRGPQINFDKMNFNITEANKNIKIKTVDDYNEYIIKVLHLYPFK